MRRKSVGKALQGSRSAFLAPTSGLAEIIEALVAYLEANQVDMRSRTRVTNLTKSGSNYQVQLEAETLEADAVILATPAYVSGNLLEEIDGELLAQILAHADDRQRHLDVVAGRV